mmetsp:Transcript_51845/g.146111  ORF Transcript_51845/g.146111 Transcript_51845/m.146111 type:complete len:472 (-) Transcript_51845:255-1670(-)
MNAVQPDVGLLEGVVGNGPRTDALRRAVGAAVVEQLRVLVPFNTQLVHAGLHEAILLGPLHRSPRQVPCGGAEVFPIAESGDGLAREDLDPPEERSGAAVVNPVANVAQLILGHLFQVPLEPVGEEDGVRVDLDHPVVERIPPVLDDAIPDPHEERGIQQPTLVVPRRVAGRAEGRRLEEDAADVAAQLDPVVAVYGVLVAGEDPPPRVELRFDEVHLGGVLQHEQPAEQRRVVPPGGHGVVLARAQGPLALARPVAHPERPRGGALVAVVALLRRLPRRPLRGHGGRVQPQLYGRDLARVGEGDREHVEVLAHAALKLQVKGRSLLQQDRVAREPQRDLHVARLLVELHPFAANLLADDDTSGVYLPQDRRAHVHVLPHLHLLREDDVPLPEVVRVAGLPGRRTVVLLPRMVHERANKHHIANEVRHLLPLRRVVAHRVLPAAAHLFPVIEAHTLLVGCTKLRRSQGHAA